MILEVGEMGINSISNSVNNQDLSMLVVYKGMNINGMPAIVKSCKMMPGNDVLVLGVDYEIGFDELDQAIEVLEILNDILVHGNIIETSESCEPCNVPEIKNEVPAIPENIYTPNPADLFNVHVVNASASISGAGGTGTF